MSKMLSANRLGALLITLGLGVAFSSGAMAQDTFAMAIGSLDHLVIFGPKGERVAEIPIPTIAKTLTVGTTTFQISYGRDADDLLTAVLTPSSSQPQDLHFSVMGKNIDADKQAVVTLTFPDARHVTIDPGYVGVVTVNSRSIRHHELADDTYAPRPAYHPASTAPVHLTSTSTSAPAPTPRMVADVTPRDVPPASSAPSAPAPSSSETSPAPVSPSAVANTAPAPAKKLFWAEPVTPFNGPPPAVGLNEMKLVDVHGPVTVQTPDGNTETGTNGLIVPSGAKVSTAAGGSAAVFMGGVNSARFLPNSDATVTQNFNGSLRKTDVNLTKGTVFCRVGKRAGEKQDYEVRTPQGVAAARGTELAVSITAANGVSYTVCFTSQGVVTMTDASGNSFEVTPTASGQIAAGSVNNSSAPPLTPQAEVAIMVQALTVLQPFNTKLNAISQALATNPGSVSGAELASYSSEAITTSTTLLDSLTASTTTVQGTTSGSTTTTNPDGTKTTVTTTTTGTTTTTTSTTTNSTGATVASSTTTQTTDSTGNVTTTTSTTDSNGNTTTTNTGGTSTNTGTTTTTSTTTTPPSTPPATGTLNNTSDLSPF
jgi:hypothetical protein